MRVPLIYKERPAFGFDLGSRTVKIMQIRHRGKHTEVIGYGYADFADEALIEGILADPEMVAAATKPLLKQLTYGKITANRVAISLPTGKIFTRMLKLPQMSPGDVEQAVRYEAEQYVPVPLADLYLDHEVIETTPDGLSVLMVAAPRAIVDSYLKLFDLLGLEVVFAESSLSAVTRAILWKTPQAEATVVADIGSHSIDITVYDRAIRLTDTIPLGGESLTEQLVKDLGLTYEQASEIKYRFGIGPSGLQPKVVPALQPILENMVREVKRIIKYYSDQAGEDRPLKTIIISGGTAAMPGLKEFLNAELGLEVKVGNAWQSLSTSRIQGITERDAPMYTTAIGLALLEGQL